MIEKLLQKNIQDFIEQHALDDEQQLLLKHKTILDVPAGIIAWQISGRRKAKIKIPLYYNTFGIVYPPGINLEQSSSEDTAKLKASILNKVLPTKNTLVDLTGGFGIDSMFLSKVFKQINYVEPDAELLAYAQHNHQILKASNIQHINSNAERYLTMLQNQVDCFFIDPSRRTSSNQKVFRLADCEPNIIPLQYELFKHSQNLLIKTSPMLDLQQGIAELQSVKQVWVFAVDNEVKELLFLSEQDYMHEPSVTAINLSKEYEEFSFMFSEEKTISVEFSDPLIYLYEPNAAILKSGAFKSIASTFKLKKLHPSTHLYTSHDLFQNFPGRIFEVQEFIKADSKSALQVIPEGKINVITRNYPLSPDAIKKKLKLSDGGDHYLIGCSGEKEKFLIVALRLK